MDEAVLKSKEFKAGDHAHDFPPRAAPPAMTQLWLLRSAVRALSDDRSLFAQKSSLLAEPDLSREVVSPRPPPSFSLSFSHPAAHSHPPRSWRTPAPCLITLPREGDRSIAPWNAALTCATAGGRWPRRCARSTCSRRTLSRCCSSPPRSRRSLGRLRTFARRPRACLETDHPRGALVRARRCRTCPSYGPASSTSSSATWRSSPRIGRGWVQVGVLQLRVQLAVVARISAAFRPPS